jgi:hypothetical protein
VTLSMPSHEPDERALHAKAPSRGQSPLLLWGNTGRLRTPWCRVLLLCVVFSLTIRARQLYVATDGSDASGDGGRETSVATLVKALELAVAHDTITFRAGTYAGHNMIRTPFLTLRSYPGEDVHITNPYGTGQDVVLRFWAEAHHGVLENLEISGGDYYTVMFFSEWESGPGP